MNNYDKCMSIIDNRFKNINEDKGPNTDINKSDYLSCKLFAYIVNYDPEIVHLVVNTNEGLQALARKGLMEISLIAGSKGWTPKT